MKNENKYIILLCFVLSIVLSPIWNYEYHRDELLFLSYGNHLSFGYYSAPPLMGLLSFIVLHLPIDIYIAIRIIGMGTFFLLLLYSTKIVRLFNGSLTLQIFTVLIMALAQHKDALMYHVTGFDIVITTIASYYLLKFLLQHNKKDIILFSILLAIGINNKYTILFFFAPLLFLLLYKKQFVIDAKTLKIVGIVLAVLVLPNLLWQIKHDFMFMKYVSHIKLNQTKGFNRITLLFEIIFSNGLGFVFTILGFWEMYKKNIVTKLCAIAALCSILIVVIAKGKTHYCHNFSPLLFCFGILKLNTLIKTKKLKLIGVICILLLFIPQFLCTSFILPPKALLGYCQFLRKNINANLFMNYNNGKRNSKNTLPQGYLNMLGWNVLVKQISDDYNKLNADSTYIFCQNYGEAGAVEIIGKKYGLPSPLCLHDNFFYWNSKRQVIEPTAMLLVSMGGYSKNLNQFFKHTEVLFVLKDDMSMEDMTSIYLFKNPTSMSFLDYWRFIIARVDNPSVGYVL